MPALPLELAIRSHPEWRELPVAVLTEDRPTGVVLQINRTAARSGICRGMRYSAALALTHLLRAALVTKDEVNDGVRAIARLLAGFSPRLEPCAFCDGVFWLDSAGLGYLFPSIRDWMQEIRRDLEDAGFHARIAAGFSRGGTLVASRTAEAARSSLLFTTPEEERAFCRHSPLGTLPLEPDARRRLAGLGIRNVGDFLSLPAGGVRLRLGPEAARLHALLSAPPSLPLQPLETDGELVLQRRLDREVEDTVELERILEEALAAIARDAESRGMRIRELSVCLSLEDGSRREERIRPSEPTGTFTLLRDLLERRIVSLFREPGMERRQGVVGFALSAQRCRGRDEQIELIPRSKSRDPAAGARAFALIRAELGNGAVRRARIRPEHPPEKQYEWEIVEGPLPSPAPSPAPLESSRVLVRRIFESPKPLPRPPSPRGRQAVPRAPAGPEYRSCGGPYALSGAWWSSPYNREYRFIEASDGTVLWIFRDGESEQWLVQGLLS